jgi:hypothetical protein
MPEIIAVIFRAIIILLLFALLVGKEVLRAVGGEKAERWMKKLNWIIAPMFLLFAVIVGLRLSSFMY